MAIPAEVLNGTIDAANKAKELDVIGLLYLIVFVLVAALVLLLRESKKDKKELQQEIKQCREEIIDLLEKDVEHARASRG